jgi:hypothetical protein
MKILNHLDLVKNELRNARVQNLGTAPSSPVEGQIYHNTTDHKLYYYDGSAWIVVDNNAVDHVVGTAPIQASEATDPTNGQTVTVSIDAATTSAAGSMSSADKTKLDDATSEATAGKLVIRDSSGAGGTTGTFKVAEPVDSAHPATKAYVDSYVQGIDAKPSVRVATTANITLSGTQTIDDVVLVAGDRVLVKNQTDAEDNGIYVVAAGSWPRAADANVSSELSPGSFVFVEEGTINGDNGYVMNADAPITLGTSDITWVQFSGAGQVVAGDGLTKTNNTLNVVGTANRITANADNVDIASTYVGQSSITTLGTITAGVWNGTDVAVADGGTGSSTAAGARVNLGVASTIAATVTGSGTTHGVTHNLNTRDITVQVWETAGSYQQVFPDIELTSVNAVDIKFSTAPGSDSYRVVVMGVQVPA